MSSPSSQPLPLWDLPEVILYHIVGFVAPPTHRAGILCHKIAPLCKASYTAVFQEERCVALWNAVLVGDYGVVDVEKHKGTRSCKRLKRSPCHKVRDAHTLLKDNTEIGYFYLSEMAHKSGKEALSKAKLCGVLEEYGPHLRINHRVSSGGTFLVEVCRARHVKECVILKCVEELVQQRGAMVDIRTFEALNSNLTALCVAAVRGMPTVVKYLLKHGANTSLTNSGRFRLVTNARKSVRCNNVTALEFAQSMRLAEIEHGGADEGLSYLNKCIKLLQRHEDSGNENDSHTGVGDTVVDDEADVEEPSAKVAKASKRSRKRNARTSTKGSKQQDNVSDAAVDDAVVDDETEEEPTANVVNSPKRSRKRKARTTSSKGDKRKSRRSVASK